MTLGMRLRTDLLWSPYAADRGDMWVAQDPVHREFYYFNALEKAIAISLDGKRTIEGIVQNVRWVDSNVTPEFVQDLIRRLDSASLLLHRNWSIVGRRNRPRALSFTAYLSSVLSLRVPIWNPSRSLHAFDVVGKCLFHPVVMWSAVVCFLIVAGWMLQSWQEILHDVAAWPMSLRGDRLLLLSVLLLAIKGLHELGHALACRWAGAECREIGVMFFFGIPCLYCDVSDAWKIPDRWKRMLISAAGIYIELLLAMAASIVWLNSTEPSVRAVSLQVVLFCTIVTIGFNANPLLRYDGYYVLSDWVRIPNLSDQSRDAWGTMWRSWLAKPGEPRHSSSHGLLALYHVVSWSYRWFLLVALVWGLHRWLVLHRMPESAATLSGAFAIAFAWLGIVGWRSNRAALPYETSFSRLKVAGLMLGAILLLVFLWTWQFEQTVFARGLIEPVRMSPMYAKQPAILTEAVDDGTPVQSGKQVLAMESPELELELMVARGELQAATQRSSLLADRGVNDALAAQQVEELAKVIQGIRERLKKLTLQSESLTLVSPMDGMFVDVIDIPAHSDFAGNQIADRWTLRDLSMNRGGVERGQLVGLVVQPDDWQVKAFVPETEVRNCKVGAAVQVRFDQSPRRTLSGVVKSISAESISRTPKALRSDVLFGSEMASEQEMKPEHTTYSLLIELEKTDWSPIANGLASVRISVGQRTPIESLWEMATSLVYRAKEW